MSNQEPNPTPTPPPEPKPRARKPRKKLKDMTPEELAERKAMQDARDKVWMHEHRPHLIATVGLVCLAVAGVTGAGSSSVGDTAQTQGAELLLIFSAIPMLLFGTDGAVFLFLGLGFVCLIVAGFFWVKLRLEKKSKAAHPPSE